jgi:lipoate-protein ligase B
MSSMSNLSFKRVLKSSSIQSIDFAEESTLHWEESEMIGKDLQNRSILTSMNKGDTLPKRTCLVYKLETVGYENALQVQRGLMDVVSQSPFDVLLLLEHPPCLTIGRFRGEKDIMATPEILANEGISIFRTDRGGGVTYHGPGQLVVYPILNLLKNKLTVSNYIWKLEEVVITTLLNLGIHGCRMSGHPGVWVGEEKICSIGLRIIRGIAMHGFALNVNPDLHYFEFIHPCGITDKKITSISRVLGYEVAVDGIVDSLLEAFSMVFHFRYEIGNGIEEILVRGERFPEINSED